jgi:hypothetical protein
MIPGLEGGFNICPCRFNARILDSGCIARSLGNLVANVLAGFWRGYLIRASGVRYVGNEECRRKLRRGDRRVSRRMLVTGILPAFL